MDHEISFGGVQYISSKRAAQKTGYAKDYIGQLCRMGKMDCRLVGRNWYVAEPSLRSYIGYSEDPKTGEAEAAKEEVAVAYTTAPKEEIKVSSHRDTFIDKAKNSNNFFDDIVYKEDRGALTPSINREPADFKVYTTTTPVITRPSIEIVHRPQAPIQRPVRQVSLDIKPRVAAPRYQSSLELRRNRWNPEPHRGEAHQSAKKPVKKAFALLSTVMALVLIGFGIFNFRAPIAEEATTLHIGEGLQNFASIFDAFGTVSYHSGTNN